VQRLPETIFSSCSVAIGEKQTRAPKSRNPYSYMGFVWLTDALACNVSLNRPESFLPSAEYQTRNWTCPMTSGLAANAPRRLDASGVARLDKRQSST